MIDNDQQYDEENVAVSNSIARIRTQVRDLSEEVSEASDVILESIKDVGCFTKGEEILNLASAQLHQIMNAKPKRWYDKIPFLSSTTSVIQRSLDRSRSIKENIENLFGALDDSTDQLKNTSRPFFQLYRTLQEAIENGDALVTAIETELETVEDHYERMLLESLQRQLRSINLVNQENFKQVDMQLRSSGALITNLGEIKPLIKGMLSSQTALAVQNARNVKLEETIEVVGTTINKLVKTNVSETNKTAIDALRLSTKPLIEKETIQHIETEHIDFSKKFVETVKEIKENTTEYVKQLESTTLQLTSNSTQLLIENAADQIKAAETKNTIITDVAKDSEAIDEAAKNLQDDLDSENTKEVPNNL